MTPTLPLPVKATVFPLISSDAGTGTARMGRTREKNVNRIKVSLYIVKMRLGKARSVPGGFYERLDSRVRVKRRDASV